jgi:hypothetical protein
LVPIGYAILVCEEFSCLEILVGEVKKIDGQKVQEVKIVYNFVGEIPEIIE